MRLHLLLPTRKEGRNGTSCPLLPQQVWIDVSISAARVESTHLININIFFATDPSCQERLFITMVFCQLVDGIRYDDELIFFSW